MNGKSILGTVWVVTILVVSSLLAMGVAALIAPPVPSHNPGVDYFEGQIPFISILLFGLYLITIFKVRNWYIFAANFVAFCIGSVVFSKVLYIAVKSAF